MINKNLSANEHDQDGKEEIESSFRELPDMTFIVDGIDFPCHMKILNKHCPILHEYVSVHGVQRRLSKRQRRIIQKMTEQRPTGVTQQLPSTFSTTVVELRDVENRVFRAILEFLYTQNVPSELYWCAIDEEESAQDQTLCCAMRFLQRLLIAADRYDIVSLKHEIEYKLYDEFLYSFTAAELFVWAYSHSCAFLKEKAMDRICFCEKNDESMIEDFVFSKDGWTMIRESKRLLEELFLYARYASHKISSMNYDDPAKHKSNQLYYYKIEYLRFRLSELKLDVDGTRKMLEERLRPHLDARHRHFLPTKLVLFGKQDKARCTNEINDSTSSSSSR